MLDRRICSLVIPLQSNEPRGLAAAAGLVSSNSSSYTFWVGGGTDRFVLGRLVGEPKPEDEAKVTLLLCVDFWRLDVDCSGIDSAAADLDVVVDALVGILFEGVSLLDEVLW